MPVEDYYRYQAIARGLTSKEDVLALSKIQGQVYDRLLAPYLPKDRKSSVYEVACGPGLFLLWLRGRGYTEVRGTDSSPEQIALAQALGLPAQCADSLAELRAMPPESLDLLIAIDFIEHVPKDVLLDFFASARRVLKPGGKLILRGPNGDSPFVGRNLFNDITHFWAYTSSALRGLLAMKGFAKVDFLDETVASLRCQRWLKVPLCLIAQRILRFLIQAATREQIECLGASFYVVVERH